MHGLQRHRYRKSKIDWRVHLARTQTLISGTQRIREKPFLCISNVSKMKKGSLFVRRVWEFFVDNKDIQCKRILKGSSIRQLLVMSWLSLARKICRNKVVTSFLIPQISHNRGSLCRQFFSDAHLGQTIYFSNFCHTDNFFPNHDTPGKK